MISLLISFAIVVILIGLVTIYTGITDYLIQRTIAAIKAAGRLRLLRAEFFHPLFHDLTKRIARGLKLSPLSLDNYLFFKRRQSSFVRKVLS